MNLDLPPAFIRQVKETWGADGAAWLGRLPQIIAECERRWSLHVEPHFPNLSFNYVAPAVRADGTRAALKLGMAGDPEYDNELPALQIFDGRGAVRVLEGDAELGAMLLERLEPGTTLVGLSLTDDERAISIASSVMKGLWRPVPEAHSFPTVERWGLGFARLRAEYGGTSGPLDPRMFERAEALYAELAASMAPPVLLHGDLHQDNILSAQREPWLVIDPKGLIGEPVYETGAILRNLWNDTLTQPEIRRILRRRVDQLSAELGFDRERIRAWGFAQAVLSAVWSAEDGGTGWEEAMTCAQALA